MGIEESVSGVSDRFNGIARSVGNRVRPGIGDYLTKDVSLKEVGKGLAYGGVGALTCIGVNSVDIPEARAGRLLDYVVGTIIDETIREGTRSVMKDDDKGVSNNKYSQALEIQIRRWEDSNGNGIVDYKEVKEDALIPLSTREDGLKFTIKNGGDIPFLVET
ncbi:MAG: hypothetical protein U9N38_06230 [Thermodesulfobacteriota bacterium]|nr:hypothetical protein [Thermodesulfobacteriota bacterium]